MSGFKTSQVVFYVGLAIMLVAAIFSTLSDDIVRQFAFVLTPVGALMAVLARAWQVYLERLARRNRGMPELGGYPLSTLQNPRFTSRRRWTF
jgi:hypothetical protein